jgi:hypothetical protein
VPTANNWRELAIAVLAQAPTGMTSKEFAQRMGLSHGSASSLLSKLFLYGIINRLAPQPPNLGVIYCARGRS